MLNYKRFGMTVLFASLAMIFMACSDDDTVETELIVSKDEITFTKEGGDLKLAIKSNYAWTITSSDTWCTLSMNSGEPGTKQFLVTATANIDTDPREATLTVVSGGVTKEVKVKQGYTDLLAVVNKDYEVDVEGETITVELQISANLTVTVNDFWIQQEPSTRAVSSKTLKFVVDKNYALFDRVGTITINLGDLEETITVSQSAASLNVTADATGMDSDAFALVKKMSLGWNLGNTLEAINNNTPSETAWGNPVTTQAMIDMVKASGINAVRLPCAWSGYIEDETTYKVRDAWFARIKEVVDYCVNNDMYVILNIHWDGGWLEENAIPEKQDEVNEKQKALWEQIAVYFRDYDEHLLFAGTNEVNSGESATKYYDVQMSYNQTFVDAVRSTGGRNTYRNLIVQSFATDIDEADAHMVMSTDLTPDRMMLEVHIYPWQFTLLTEDQNDTWGKALYLWGDDYIQYESIAGLAGRASNTANNETFVLAQFDKIKTKFVDNGYPAILGEYGAIRRPNLSDDALERHLESRAYYMEFTTREAKKHGLVPFAWDTGTTSYEDYPMTIFNRRQLTVFDQQLLDALLKGSQEGAYPF